MTTYAAVYELNERGLDAFRRIFNGDLDESAIDPTDREFATRVVGTGRFDDSRAATAKELAQRVLISLGSDWAQYLPNTGLWAWLTLVLRDSVFPADAQGNRKPGEIHRWYPSDPSDWQKAQRHLVRMPVVLLANLGDVADHLLCGSPSVGSEIREQLTSQQDMFTPEFQKLARRLYFNDDVGKLRRGAGGSGGGSPRRLAKVRKQLVVTWNLHDLNADEQLTLLPGEFDRFRPAPRAP